jgi:spore germination protein KA
MKSDYQLTASLEDNLSKLYGWLGHSKDLTVKKLQLRGIDSERQDAALLYINGMIDKTSLQDSILPSLLQSHSDEYEQPVSLLHVIKSRMLCAGDVTDTDSFDLAVERLLSGHLLVVIDGLHAVITTPITKFKERAISESKTQSVVRGPMEAFTESLDTNLSLIRRRIKDPRLRAKEMTVGSVTNTCLCIVYMEGFADPKVIDELTHKLKQIPLKGVLEGQYIESYINGMKWPVFPVVYNTDRPDTVTGDLLKGKVAILLDGTPFALLVPVLFVEFIHSTEDYYQPSLYGSMIRLLRFFTVLLTIFAPSMYIAITTLHQEMLPSQLIFSLAAQREGVPFPALVEALLMETSFEILREAGIRMPRAIGQAVSIVGTIVIGQAAVEAAIVSPAMVIIVAITGISSFVIPAYNMSIGLRMLRFPFMFAAASFGLFGITTLSIIVIFWMCSIRSFGIPYMSPNGPYIQSKQDDNLVRTGYEH